MNRDQFSSLAQQIVEIFPNEAVETYFMPCKPKQLARGKLWDAYNNLRTKLSAAGLIQRRPRITNTISKTITINESVEKEIDWNVIQNNNGDWNCVLEIWKATFQARKGELNGDISTASYFEKYKVLQEPNAYELVSNNYFKRTLYACALTLRIP